MSIDAQIDEMTTRITDCTAQIAALESACSVENEELCAIICRKKNRFERLLENYNRMKNKLVEMKANQESGYTTEQQAIVDSINTTFSNAYSAKLEELKKGTTEEKTKFFELYAAAVTGNIVEIFLDCQF